ncbi:Transmembrane emp24 domain-containing protein [Quillaja saponaria]|uniref:Transmembrane emp24 domain-containing protein n=1 Tax=Quillaja saponaria TaxID=32244 RepID=A0AAD7LL07_QUISA|nr:Transmembrane emp24 domain-containing protein [Quillaja saponaria]
MGKRALWLPFLVVPVFFTSSLVRPAHAIWLNLPTTRTKCVFEEIQNNVVVLVDYIVVSDDPSSNPTIAVKVTSPYVNNLHHQENTTQSICIYNSRGWQLARMFLGGLVSTRRWRCKCQS